MRLKYAVMFTHWFKVGFLAIMSMYIVKANSDLSQSKSTEREGSVNRWQEHCEHSGNGVFGETAW